MNNLLQDKLNYFFPKFLSKIDINSDEYRALVTGIEFLKQKDLTHAKLNQLLHLCSRPGISQGYYKYYFLTIPEAHPYSVESIVPAIIKDDLIKRDRITDSQQLEWGLTRIMYDSMLYFGNFLKAFITLHKLTFEEISDFFKKRCVDTEYILTRGPIENPELFSKDNRFLISEMACKTYEEITSIEETTHVKIALEAFKELKNSGQKITSKLLKLKAKDIGEKNNQGILIELLLDESDEIINSTDDVIRLYSGQYEKFKTARNTALNNTRLYLSFINDLDIYIATSMRTREDFREVATLSDTILNSVRLKQFNLRYFDPTLSAANHHEDKGLIECLMVKKAKVLIYFAQHKESLGKVSEFAMALSLGKPVIIICPEDKKGKELLDFYKNKHPLMRLVDFRTGVVNGALITNRVEDVIELLYRVLSNRMVFKLEKKENREAYYLLKEEITDSTYRIITDDKMLTETFWNYYSPD